MGIILKIFGERRLSIGPALSPSLEASTNSGSTGPNKNKGFSMVTTMIPSLSTAVIMVWSLAMSSTKKMVEVVQALSHHT